MGLRYRQIHLDFHTSPDIPEIGALFDRKEFQEALKTAEVDSITCFSCCHHGLSYHPTRIGKMHPGLKFNLLREQIDACHEIGVNVPVYITAGVNSVAAAAHPEWREISRDGQWNGWRHSPLEAGFDKLCFNTPYLDYLCALIEETVTMFPDCDGIFLDIISQGQCCCRECMEEMVRDGLNPEVEADRIAHARKVLLKYYERSTAAARVHRPDMPVFHNSGHVTMGDTEILRYFSHLELESLPTGGWGYDHYPMSAAYSRNLGMEFLGMTGKFQTTWGEFGGLKHPNALRYECAAMLANGSRCSIGDQLHPSGKFDASTAAVIGAAYREVKEKEAYCRGAESVAAVAVLGRESITRIHAWFPEDSGAARVLLEEHIPFDFVDTQMDWSKYRFLLLPDEVCVTPELAVKLDAFRADGGKLILSGESGMNPEKNCFALKNLPFDWEGPSSYSPDYVQAAAAFAPEFATTPFVMYTRSQRIHAKPGAVSLGSVYDPYFNRDWRHFCSHQHTPYRPEPSGYDAGAMGDDVLYFAHPVFTLYRGWGAVAVREFIGRALRAFLGDALQLKTELPSTGRVTLMRQKEESRYILHLLYANTIIRGGSVTTLSGETIGRDGLEVIEELNPLPAGRVVVNVPEPVRRVVLVPENREIEFTRTSGGEIEFFVPEFRCHRMVALEF